MTHLPECTFAPERGTPPGGPVAIYQAAKPCICAQLRACEQRVLLSKPNIELSAVYGYEAGRLDGLSAARDAVAALDLHTHYRITCEPPSPVDWTQHKGKCDAVADALAAIDALGDNP